MNRGYGAILGDLAGKPFEKKFSIKKKDIKVYAEDTNITDDSVMTLATMDAILSNIDYQTAYRYWGNKYFSDYYGKSFKLWLKDPAMKMDSYGNGCLMRMSPIPHYFRNNDYSSIIESVGSCTTSHNHAYSRKAVIILNYIYNMIYEGKTKVEIWDWVKENYPLPKRFNKFVEIDATSQGTLPYVLHCFLSTTSTHACIEMAIGYGGDTDTNASIAAELSATFYDDISKEDVEYVNSHLDDFQLDTLTRFNNALNEI